jgi:sulfite reductase beta subunit-like hemoprotein
MSGCKASCAQIALAHVGFRATIGKDEQSVHDAFDVALGGDAGAGHLATWRRGELPADAAFIDITRLLASVANGEFELSDLIREHGSWSGGSDPISDRATS